MISAFFIFNQKGEVLISRLYRPDVRRSVSDAFRIQVLSSPQIRSPVCTYGNVTFFHISHENIYLVAVSKVNANAATVFEYLYSVANLGKSYFGKFNDEAVKNNFTLIYELFDEILDFGIPQISEVDTLKLYITTEGVKSERARQEESSKITIQATGAISWRRPGIKYRKNEAFVDVIESINLIVSSKGTVVRSDVSGQVVMKAYLSGTPECKFGLNDKLFVERDGGGGRQGMTSGRKTVEIDDCQFHQCVKLGRFEADRSISFVPPDGEFELMKYRTTDQIQLPFKVHAVVNEISQTRIEYKISIKSLFEQKYSASHVIVRIPTPLNCATAKMSMVTGRAKYVPADNAIVWKIPTFQGNTTHTLTAEAQLSATTVKKAWSRPPISVDFEVPMFTASGLMVRFLKVFEKSDYETVKWVRYKTKAGSYQFRF